MAGIPGTNVAGPVVPFDTADTYATHDAAYGKGGFRSVNSIAERDAIPTDRRAEGMRVRVIDDPSPANNVDWDWIGMEWVASTMAAEAALAPVLEASQVARDAAQAAAVVAGERADQAQAAATSLRVCETWSELAMLTGAEDGQGALVVDDSGSHVDPVKVGSQVVPNAGQYRWVDAEGAWEWLRADLMAEGYAKAVAVESRVESTGVSPLAEIERSSLLAFGSQYGALLNPVVDAEDKLIGGYNTEGHALAPKLLSSEFVIRDDLGDQYNYAWAFVVGDDQVVFGLHRELGLLGLGGSAEAELIARLDRYALALRDAPADAADYATLCWDLTHIIGNGQSLMQGHEAWPRLTRTQRHGNLMYGNSVRPASPSLPAFTPIGGAALQPLISTVQVSAGTLIDDAAVAALSPGDQSMGETPMEACANALRRHLDDKSDGRSDQLFVVSNVAVGGQTVEQLSKGASPHRYQRYLDAVAGVKSIATAQSKSYGVGLICLAQGEYNYVSDFGGDTTFDGYKTKFLQWVADHVADARSVAGQTRDPAVLTYQTGASYTRDDTLLSVGMAQWRATKERRGLYLAGPAYPVTNKGGHLDANGSRWLGCYYARAAHRVLIERRPWCPLEPVEVQQDGRYIYVAYRVPKPPIRFGLPWVSSAATDYAAKGFRVQDAGGAYLTISGVQIVSPCVVRIELAVAPSSAVHVWYATQAIHGGNGNVCDSDTFLADDAYEWLADSGMYPVADIAELKNNPYPMANWSVAFRLPAGFKELS